MAASLSPYPKLQFFDDDGSVLAAGKVYTYETGTTTPQSAYTTSAGDVPHANPIILDSAGRATIFLGQGLTYRLVVKRSDDTTVYTVDGVSAANTDGFVDVTTDQTIGGTKTFSVSPLAPTPSAGDSSTKVATTAFVTTAVTALWSTGDVKLTMKTVADSGWVLCNDGTIGNASSGGTARANADTSALFTLLWTNCSDAVAPVSSGRGASAAADFAANKTIALTKMLGRALAVAGSGSGLTTRALGVTVGAETHTLTTDEMPAHTHDSLMGGVLGVNGASEFNTRHAGSTATGSAGGDGAHNNMQPTAFLNAMIKL